MNERTNDRENLIFFFEIFFLKFFPLDPLVLWLPSPEIHIRYEFFPLAFEV